jgi:hypothetical protein
VHDAVLAACDAADGLADRIVSATRWPAGQTFDVTRLRCTPAQAADSCLTDAQIRAVQTLHAPLPMPVRTGQRRAPSTPAGPRRRGHAQPSAPPAAGRPGGRARAAPTLPPSPANGIAWFYGSGAMQYFYARDPNADPRTYTAESTAARVREVSALMDSTNPDLSAFQRAAASSSCWSTWATMRRARYAGIQYVESVKAPHGPAQPGEFLRLYTAPGVDHVGTGAPAWSTCWVRWWNGSNGPAHRPGLTLVEQDAKPPFAVKRSRPLCEWPAWPKYQGGDANAAGSFACVK